MKRVLIFEGPDGGGKTTLARVTRDALGDAVLTHHGPYPDVTDHDALAEIYALSMLPALDDRHDVILDRCWLSEIPYGLAFRGGADRLTWRGRRYLETAAAQCDARVYLCLPSWNRVADNYQARKGEEYLETLAQLRRVYRWYEDAAGILSSLPITVVDPFDGRDHVKEIIDGR